MDNIKFVDFFSGVGGFHLGFQRDFTECVYACEIDKYARKTYLENYNLDEKNFAYDITKLNTNDMPDFDIFCGGFPCQAFSIAGLRKGLTDVRGQLFLDICRILNDKKPKAFLLENVRGLLTHDNGQTFSFICKSLENCGYSVQYQILNTHLHGNLPQNRERIFIIGIRQDIIEKLPLGLIIWPAKIPLRKKLSDIFETNIDSKFYYNNKTPIYSKLLSGVIDKNTIYQYRRGIVRENKRNLCPTLTANMGTGGHNIPLVLDDNGIRKLTPRECFRLQGFPDTFKLPNIASSHLYKQAGNSVSVPVISRLADIIFEIIK
jgi:DNA (cytosine-5)-methyltransferase 1